MLRRDKIQGIVKRCRLNEPESNLLSRCCAVFHLRANFRRPTPKFLPTVASLKPPTKPMHATSHSSIHALEALAVSRGALQKLFCETAKHGDTSLALRGRPRVRGRSRRPIPRTLEAWFWLFDHDVATRPLDGAREVSFSCFDVLNDNPPFPSFSMQVSSSCEQDKLTPNDSQP
jgi:hypothetical protein